ncbi:alpha/beta hydrolase [Sneathiella marina]|uniref:Alpha/beta hydrolase n=1 Tax=Sneathiella marina TaxID=2950108 RepID=A0ABY4W8A5_9PROT|nr:alpha/beta fold hydrolase [Sneathiella marina]USG63014.1 alpha/beta hydrolase [Sneathiella marina]
MIITVNGVDLDTRLEGPENAPVVTLGHSLCCDLTAWDELTNELKHEYRVLRYSLRGHGQSAGVEGPYTFRMLATDVAAIQDHYDIKTSHFVGLSIGGMIGQKFALMYPERVKSLVISSSLCELPEGAAAIWPERIREVQENGIEAQVESSMARWFAEGALNHRPDLDARVRAMIKGTSVDGYVGCSQAIQAIDLVDLIPAIEASTLVIVGRQDMGTPIASSELIHRQIEDSKMVILENASHQAAMEKPDEFNAFVRVHLAENA